MPLENQWKILNMLAILSITATTQTKTILAMKSDISSSFINLANYALADPSSTIHADWKISVRSKIDWKILVL